MKKILICILFILNLFIYTYSNGQNIEAKLGNSDNTSKFIIKNSNNIEKFSITDGGRATMKSLVLGTYTINTNQIINDLDVSNISIIFCKPTSNDGIIFNGLSGGVLGQVVYIISTSTYSCLINRENISGIQKFRLYYTTKQVSGYGIKAFIFDGNYWFIYD